MLLKDMLYPKKGTSFTAQQYAQRQMRQCIVSTLHITQ